MLIPLRVSLPVLSQMAGETCSMWLLTSGRLLLDGELLRDVFDGRLGIGWLEKSTIFNRRYNSSRCFSLQPAMFYRSVDMVKTQSSFFTNKSHECLDPTPLRQEFDTPSPWGSASFLGCKVGDPLDIWTIAEVFKGGKIETLSMPGT